jgi:FlaG/FlaF family flagellin (archaellin)
LCGGVCCDDPDTQICGVDNATCVTRGDYTVTLFSAYAAPPNQIIAKWSLGNYPINLNDDLVVVNISVVNGRTENVQATFANSSITGNTWTTTATLQNPLQCCGYSITVTVMNDKVSNPQSFPYNPNPGPGPLPL